MASAEIIPPDLLVMAYSQGVFPMAMQNGEIGWFSPDPRGVIPFDQFRVPHGLRRALAAGRFEIRFDTAFREVMESCADREDTWINRVIIDSYCGLHARGCAHSVEAWLDGGLAGGCYGVALGGAFFGESMFHRVTDASKVALHALVGRLRQQGFTLLDIQWTTPHLRQFGAIEIARTEYLDRLAAALTRPVSF